MTGVDLESCLAHTIRQPWFDLQGKSQNEFSNVSADFASVGFQCFVPESNLSILLEETGPKPLILFHDRCLKYILALVYLLTSAQPMHYKWGDLRATCTCIFLVFVEAMTDKQMHLLLFCCQDWYLIRHESLHPVQGRVCQITISLPDPCVGRGIP